MGVTKKPSGVNIIGLGAADLNEFKPVDQLKDLYIQLTADGATEESMDYLAYLKSYAEHNQSIGLPIMPNGVNVWISNNGKTSAVEADDLSLEDGVYTICGIKCEDGEWDFTNAGQHSGGGGGGGGGLLVTATMVSGDTIYATLDKNYTEITTAIQNGINPVFIMEMGGVLKVLVLTAMGEDESEPYYGVTLELNSDAADFSSESPTGVLTWNAQ